MTLFTWSQATFRRFRLSIPPRFTLQILRLTRDISWIGDGPPIAEPHCGYHGEKCTCTCVFTILLLLLLPSFFILSFSFNFIRLAIKINQFRDNFLFFSFFAFTFTTVKMEANEVKARIYSRSALVETRT